MRPCDRGRGNCVLLIKAAVKVIQFIGKSSVGSGNILWRGRIAFRPCQVLQEMLVVRFSSSLSRYLALPVWCIASRSSCRGGCIIMQFNVCSR